jgi:uncharacterized protein (DUF58 family)
MNRSAVGPERFHRLRAWLACVPLTREGLLWFIIASSLLVIGLVKGINLITLLASLLVVLVLWNGWVARRQLWPVRVERLEEEPAFAQTPFRWAVQLHNGGRRAVSGIDVRDGSDQVPQTWFVTELAAGASAVLRGEVTYPRRGRVDGEVLTVESGHPLGLARFRRKDEPDRSRIVLPRLGRLHRAQLRRYLTRRSPTLGQSRGLPCHVPTAQAEFHGLRPYRPGDSLRHLHWRTTARRGELMVREYEDWPNDDLTIVLEARREPGEGDDPLLEAAISLTATVCWEWCRQTGDRLVLAVAGAESTIHEGVSGHKVAREMLERLAVEPGAVTLDTGPLLTRLQQHKLSPGPILVISPRPSDVAEQLQHALRRRTAPVAVGAGDAAPFYEP